MALTTNQLVVGMFNMASGGYNSLVSDYITVNGDVAAADALLQFTGLNPQFAGANVFSDADFASALVTRIIPGLSASLQTNITSIVINYMDANPALSRGAIVVALINAVDAIPASDPVLGAAAAAFDAKVALADASTSTSVDFTELQAEVGGVPDTFTLTDGIDNIVGTAADNIISAPVVQNQNGELVNSLETGDAINGGEGIDILNAVLTNSQGTVAGILASAPAISATMSGVEIVNYRTQYDNNDIMVNNSHIDAELHTGVQQYWSDNSRADIQIEDVRQLPEELTFGMRQTDPGVSFNVYFDPAQLAADRGIAGDSSLTLTLIDNSAGANELENFPVNGIVFTLDGTEYTVGTEEALGATYVEFVDNLQAALQADPDLADVTVTLNANNTITLTDPAGATFGAVGYTWVGNIVPSGGELQWNQAVGAAVVSEAAITTNVILDAVGRTSQGGTLDIGSMADGGIEVFNVSVDRSSWLSGMESREYFGEGDRHLETVNLTSIGANGDLAIGEEVVGETGELDGRVEGGLIDVREVLNTGFEGELSYGVILTNDSIDRYLDDATGEVQFTYEGGNGNDNVTISDDSTSGDLSNDGDFALDVALGDGDDRLNIEMPFSDNVVVDGGTGSNTIAVSRSHGTTDDNTFEGFTGFQTYEVEGTGEFIYDVTEHDFTSMAGVTQVNIATDDDNDEGGDFGDSTLLRDLAANAAVTITGKNQTLGNDSNADQYFWNIAIEGADATATDTELTVTLENTARSNGVLTVNLLELSDETATNTSGINTLEVASTGVRATANVVNSIDANRVTTLNLTGTQNLDARVDDLASVVTAGQTPALTISGAELTGDLTLALDTAILDRDNLDVLTGTAGDADTLQLVGEQNGEATTISGFETVQFGGDVVGNDDAVEEVSGVFNAINVSGVDLYAIEAVDPAAAADAVAAVAAIDAAALVVDTAVAAAAAAVADDAAAAAADVVGATAALAVANAAVVVADAATAAAVADDAAATAALAAVGAGFTLTAPLAPLDVNAPTDLEIADEVSAYATAILNLKLAINGQPWDTDETTTQNALAALIAGAVGFSVADLTAITTAYNTELILESDLAAARAAAIDAVDDNNQSDEFDALVAAYTAAQATADLTDAVALQATADLADAVALEAATDLADAVALQVIADATDAVALQTAADVAQADLDDLIALGGTDALEIINLDGDVNASVNGDTADANILFQAGEGNLTLASAAGNTLTLEVFDDNYNSTITADDFGSVSLTLTDTDSDVDTYDFGLDFDTTTTTLVVAGGDDAGSVTLDGLEASLTTIDFSAVLGDVEASLTDAAVPAVDNTNTTITVGTEGDFTFNDLTSVDTVTTFVFTGDVAEDGDIWTLDGFQAFNDMGGSLSNLSILNLSALGVNGLADVVITQDAFDTVITSNEGLDFEITLVAVDSTTLSNENFAFA